MKRLLLQTFIIAVIATLFAIPVFAADVVKGTKSTIDISNTSNGYVSVTCTDQKAKKLKVTIEKGTMKYTYDLNTAGKVVRYPLQMGDGSYSLKVLENISGTKYSVIQTHTFTVKLKNQYAPFLVSNQFVDYNSKSTTVAKATETVKGAKDKFEKVDKVYAYVSGNITYDTNKAATVQSGYLPNVDSVLASKKGICFDYSAVMAAMLRSQNIPTKLVTGYVAPNNAYHAWTEVYIDGVGWVKTGDIKFDGKNWKLMDPTFMAASKSGSTSITKFIGDGSNYQVKYQY